MLHSLVDYPLRTAGMMAIMAFACALLIEPFARADRSEKFKLQTVSERARPRLDNIENRCAPPLHDNSRDPRRAQPLEASKATFATRWSKMGCRCAVAEGMVIVWQGQTLLSRKMSQG